MAPFTALLIALTARYVRFLRSRDDTLAFVGMVGLALVAGFFIKNLTDDFLFRSNAKEFWALSAMLLGYGMQRSRDLSRSASATGDETHQVPRVPRTATQSASTERADAVSEVK
jgi:hypothetical protein